MDQRTRKLMTMHKALHPRSNVDRLYVSRKEGGGRLTCIEDSVGASIQWKEDCIQKWGGRLITATRNNTDNMSTNRLIITRKQKSEEKQLCGRFKWLIINIYQHFERENMGNLKGETQSHQITAQNNTIRTNPIEARINKTQQNSKCSISGNREETINHIISECSKLAQMEYKTRHDWVGKMIHWELCRKFKFDYTNKWYVHNSTSVMENGHRQTPMGF